MKAPNCSVCHEPIATFHDAHLWDRPELARCFACAAAPSCSTCDSAVDALTILLSEELPVGDATSSPQGGVTR